MIVNSSAVSCKKKLLKLAGHKLRNSINFISGAYNKALRVSRNFCDCERPHMLSYYVTFFVIQFKIAAGIFKSNLRMLVAMKLAWSVMPVVKKIVVQKAAARG